MDRPARPVKVGDRVRALRREGFPQGVVVEALDEEFLLVSWQSPAHTLLETVHRDDIALVDAP